jgi:hypothetical protein
MADMSSANICLPQNATALQLVRIVVKWLQDHPQNLTGSRTDVVHSAFFAAFPCEHLSDLTQKKKGATP